MNAHQECELLSAQEVLTWAIRTYGDRITFASSFGAEDVVIIDMLSKIKPDIDIFFLDTGLHFKETYQTIERLAKKYGRTFTRITPQYSLEEQSLIFGKELWKKSPDQCCTIRKVQPLIQYLSNFDAWITGIRREQSITRANAKKVEYDHRFNLMKINPIADWNTSEVWNYIAKHHVPYNPLHDQNYPSIGCAVCTSPVAQGEDLRSGRWAGFAKTECGLHR